jgi:hypothetical protein
VNHSNWRGYFDHPTSVNTIIKQIGYSVPPIGRMYSNLGVFEQPKFSNTILIPQVYNIPQQQFQMPTSMRIYDFQFQQLKMDNFKLMHPEYRQSNFNIPNYQPPPLPPMPKMDWNRK